MEAQVELPPQPSHAQSPIPDGNGSSSSSTASSTGSIPMTTTVINASHYQILMTGDVDSLRELLAPGIFRLSDLATEFDESSALHVAAAAGHENLIHVMITEFNTDDDNLLLRPNKKGDLPIHFAARAGNKQAAEKLVFDQRFRHKMLESGNKDGNTALHIALENQQKDMAEMLFEKCPHTFYRMNANKMSPLCLAIKAGFHRLARRMIQTDVLNPGEVEEQLCKGQVIHAAIRAKNLCTMREMLRNFRELFKSCDEKGRWPLSYAAYTGFLEGVQHLVDGDNFKNIAFKPDGDIGDFPIHWACRGGNIQVVNAFLKHSSHLIRSLNRKQQSILHVAAESGQAKVVNYILGLENSYDLVNMKDEDGNTPLHLAARGKHPRVVYLLTWDPRIKLNLQNDKLLTALDIAEDHGQVPSFQERLSWLALRYAGVPRSQTHSHTVLTISNPNPTPTPTPTPSLTQENEVPRENFTAVVQATMNNIANHPIQTSLAGIPNNASEPTPTNKYKERLSSLLVASTIVATVTYNSAFTVPGGYKQDIGMVVLAKRASFKVFVISDMVALFCSILVVVTLLWAHLDDLRLILLALDFAIPLLGISLVMMCVAFMAGLYVTLQHAQLWLGIMVLLMGGLLLGAVLVFFVPLYSPTSHVKFRVLRYVFHIPFMLMLLAYEKGHSQTLYSSSRVIVSQM